MALLTEAQLEAAAREYCSRKNIDPDESVAHGAAPDEHGVVQAVVCYSKRWELIAGEIRRADELRDLIEFGLAQDPAPSEQPDNTLKR